MCLPSESFGAKWQKICRIPWPQSPTSEGHLLKRRPQCRDRFSGPRPGSTDGARTVEVGQVTKITDRPPTRAAASTGGEPEAVAMPWTCYGAIARIHRAAKRIIILLMRWALCGDSFRVTKILDRHPGSSTSRADRQKCCLLISGTCLRDRCNAASCP